MERFIDIFIRAIKKANGIEAENEELQEFLSFYRVTPNPNTSVNMFPAELMFARKIRSVFDKLIPSKKGNKKKSIPLIRLIVQGKNYFLNYHLGKATLLEGIIEKIIGNMMYIIKHQRWKDTKFFSSLQFVDILAE